MTRSAGCTAVGLALAAGLAQALVSAYKVEPVCAAWSGKVKYDVGVGQTVVANFDSVVYCELFVGDNGTGGAYNLVVLDSTTTVAYQNGKLPGQNDAWLRFDNIQMEPGESFVKGKQYVFKFTRGGSDSIQFYTDPTGPYEFGDIVIPVEGRQSTT